MKLSDILTERIRNAGRDPMQATKSREKRIRGEKRDAGRYEKGKIASKSNRPLKDRMKKEDEVNIAAEIQ